MFALNLKYSFNTLIKPNVGVGIDYLSGDDNGASDNESIMSLIHYMQQIINIMVLWIILLIFQIILMV